VEFKPTKPGVGKPANTRFVFGQEEGEFWMYQVIEGDRIQKLLNNILTDRRGIWL
jgi:hypothetical protein